MSDAERLLDMFRAMNPEQFTAMVLARKHGSIHANNFYSRESPGVEYTALILLEERGLIRGHEDKPGYYRLTHLGKRLMGEPTGERLPGFFEE